MNTKIMMLAVALTVAAGSATAQDFKAGPIEIAQPWARATPRGASVAIGYLKVTNTGTAPDRLVGGSSDIADRVEIHEMTMTDGVMRMRPMANGLEIKPGQSVELKPGSSHIMFMGLRQPLQQGQKIKGKLTFEKAGTVDLEYAVGPIGGGAPSMGGHMH
jgi:periplasmic copper chaperone A